VKANYKLAVTLVVGVMIGLATGTVIHAQQTKAPLAYVVAEPIVSDSATFQKYGQQVPGTLAPFGGRFIVRGGKVQAVEGDPPQRFVIIAFDSAEKANAWENSPQPMRRSSRSDMPQPRPVSSSLRGFRPNNASFELVINLKDA
jgi:uncharacterized protein (DUF1330 family)